jgi:hypothetical protein
MTQAVECLPCKLKALSSNPNPTKKKNYPTPDAVAFLSGRILKKNFLQ